MAKWLDWMRRHAGRKLAGIHAWNGWIVLLLAATGLLLASGFWRGVLGEGRVWLKWVHIAAGLVSVAPIILYMTLIGKHWRLLKGRPWQRFNIVVVLTLLAGWLLSGVILWQFRLAGPALSNAALVAHDLLTWIGLPYIIYHSLTRTRWIKQAGRRAVITERSEERLHPAAPQPLYTRRAFLRTAIGAGLAVAFGPSLLQWVGRSLGSTSGSALERLAENDKNRLLPAPQPLADSSPPVGGGAQGHFRIYTVTPIPAFTNNDWSFTVDGLVDRPFTWNWEEFVSRKRTVQVSDFHCVTGWSVYRNTWEGIPLRELLDLAGVRPEAKTVKLYSGDGVYTESLTLDQARMDDVMVAVLHDGRPLPSDLGGPARLIVPKMYAYKSIKWLNRIELITGDHDGYWIERGYSKDAWV